MQARLRAMAGTVCFCKFKPFRAPDKYPFYNIKRKDMLKSLAKRSPRLGLPFFRILPRLCRPAEESREKREETGKKSEERRETREERRETRKEGREKREERIEKREDRR